MIFLDFEFSRSKHPILRLWSCVTHKLDNDWKIIETKRFWLLDDSWEHENLKAYIEKNKDQVFIGFSNVAEARSVYSLYLDPMKFLWIDLMLEWRCLTNHNNKLSTGNQLVDGKVRYYPVAKPKWERREGEKGASKLKHSLAEATYKLTGEIRDTEEKDRIRDYIISDPDEVPEDMQEKILDYNEEDVVYLPRIYKAVIEQYKSLLRNKFNNKKLYEAMLLRGRYAALTAIRESKGYPIKFEHVKNFSKAVDFLIAEVQREINDLFPDVKPFNWIKREQRFSWSEKKTQKWLIDNGYADKWMLTDTYDRDKKRLPKGEKLATDDYLSLSLEAWQEKFPFKHTYPEDNFGAQIVRFLILRQNLNGFKSNPGKDKKTFWDAVGPDQRVRPYMNIYGAQSSRSQPAATGFMFLKPAWMRAMVSPPPGKAMCSIDYGSEEFFISALLSGDQNMIKAYLSGDVYLYFAKLAKAVPWDGLRKDFEAIRDLFKSTTLGISYLMTKWGLAIKLTQDTGIPHTEQEAQDLIDKFYSAFGTFNDWQQEDIKAYYEGQPMELPDGWIMWPDNINHRSAANSRIQGWGAMIMRRADFNCYDAGLYIPFTLHDALFSEFDSDDFSTIDKQAEAMKEAFVHYFPKHLHKYAEQIKLDFTVWSEDYEDGEILTTPGGRKVKAQKKYIDKRAKEYYEKYKYYLEHDIYDF